MKLPSWGNGELLRCSRFDQPNRECLTRPGDSSATSSISATDIERTILMQRRCSSITYTREPGQ